MTYPVDRSGHAVLVASLQGIDHTQDLGSVAASRSRVGENQADGLLGIDNEDGAHSERLALLVDVLGVLVIEPTTSLSA